MCLLCLHLFCVVIDNSVFINRTTRLTVTVTKKDVYDSTVVSFILIQSSSNLSNRLDKLMSQSAIMSRYAKLVFLAVVFFFVVVVFMF